MFLIRSYFLYCFFEFFFYKFFKIFFWFNYFYHFHGFTSKFICLNGFILCSTLDIGFSPNLSFSDCLKRLSILFSFDLLVFLINCSRIWSSFWFSFSNISFKFCCSTFIFYNSFLQNFSSLISCFFYII